MQHRFRTVLHDELLNDAELLDYLERMPRTEKSQAIRRLIVFGFLVLQKKYDPQSAIEELIASRLKGDDEPDRSAPRPVAGQSAAEPPKRSAALEPQKPAPASAPAASSGSTPVTEQAPVSAPPAANDHAEDLLDADPRALADEPPEAELPDEDLDFIDPLARMKNRPRAN